VAIASICAASTAARPGHIRKRGASAAPVRDASIANIDRRSITAFRPASRASLTGVDSRNIDHAPVPAATARVRFRHSLVDCGVEHADVDLGRTIVVGDIVPSGVDRGPRLGRRVGAGYCAILSRRVAIAAVDARRRIENVPDCTGLALGVACSRFVAVALTSVGVWTRGGLGTRLVRCAPGTVEPRGEGDDDEARALQSIWKTEYRDETGNQIATGRFHCALTWGKSCVYLDDRSAAL
jgi:hypothetical protein